MEVTRTRRITAIGQETHKCIIPDGVIEKIMMKDPMTKDEAVEEALTNGDYETVSIEFEVDEVLMEHDSSIEF